MKLKAKLDEMLSSSLKLNENSTNIFENQEGFLRPRLKSVVDSLQADVLRDIPVSPVVAGGFIRDILVGATPKDLDVFIQFGPQLDEFDRDHFKNLIGERLDNDERLFFSLRDMSKDYGHTASEGQVLDGVLEFDCAGLHLDNNDEMWYPPPIQLIAHRREPAELLDRFDLNICKVAYLPREDTFIYTPEFMDDFTNKKVTLDDRYSNNLASLKRYDRIERKMRRAWNPDKDKKIMTTKTRDPEFFERALAAEQMGRNAARGIPLVPINNPRPAAEQRRIIDDF